jgi:hypothetical protein
MVLLNGSMMLILSIIEETFLSEQYEVIVNMGRKAILILLNKHRSQNVFSYKCEKLQLLHVN